MDILGPNEEMDECDNACMSNCGGHAYEYLEELDTGTLFARCKHYRPLIKATVSESPVHYHQPITPFAANYTYTERPLSSRGARAVLLETHWRVLRPRVHEWRSSYLLKR